MLKSSPQSKAARDNNSSALINSVFDTRGLVLDINNDISFNRMHPTDWRLGVTTSLPAFIDSASSTRGLATSSPHNSAASTTVRRVDLFPAQTPPRRLRSAVSISSH